MSDEFKKVYLVTHGEYSDYSVDAVFSTREAAEKMVRRLNAGHDHISSNMAVIEEYLLDVPTSVDN